MILGVDVSSNNGGGTGEVNFPAIKAAGRTFVMVRAGYGFRRDGQFEGYVSEAFGRQVLAAQAAGLEVGAYWYTAAATVEEARAEARACVGAAASYQLTYPIAFDQEYQPTLADLSRQERTDLCKAFLEEVRAAGYYPMLYASKDWFEEFLDDGQLAGYDHWVADYAPALTYAGPGPVGLWQNSGTGSIEGVEGPIDLDVSYRNYPEVIRRAGLNHLAGEGPSAPPSTGGKPEGGGRPESSGKPEGGGQPSAAPAPRGLCALLGRLWRGLLRLFGR